MSTQHTIQPMTFAFTSAHVPHSSQREEGSLAHEHTQGTPGGASESHVSVLKAEVLEALAPQAGEVVLDATAGMGGHSEALLTAAPVQLVALDADPAAVARAQARLGQGAVVLNANFADLKEALLGQGIQHINKALFDLGWNMTQRTAGKGLSFLAAEEPLHMGYSEQPRSGFTAAEVLNTWSEQAIADALFGYGEERYARRIAKVVVERRSTKPFALVGDFVEVLLSAVPAAYRRGRIHPATRSFQALRIAVNDELGALRQGLAAAWELLLPQGRIAVITFHSIEDRVVKQYFAGLSKDEEGRLLYKKPLTPSEQELITNPSARSAKLRAIEKI